MLRVVEIQTGGVVAVDARGLFRVIIYPENRIADELVTADEADAFVSTFNACYPSRMHWAEAIGYSSNLALT